MLNKWGAKSEQAAVVAALEKLLNISIPLAE
jgi:hypothetical protein